ncbi:MAG: outer membrane protein assembly factor BamA [Phycisphaerales bacterium]|nr:MAG: outer membrane protein assembly factor BamA [Phycisphaerales bacterium]
MTITGANSALAQNGAGDSGAGANGPSSARAGVVEGASPFEGRPVRRVSLLATKAGASEEPAFPLEGALDRLARNQLRLREGLPYSTAVSASDVGLLTRLGPFRTIETRVVPLDDGSVELRYTMVLQPVILDVVCVGNSVLTDTGVLEGVGSLRGTPVDGTRIERASRAIEKRYLDEGYFNAQVTADIPALERSGTLVFRVREGQRTNVRTVRFRGNVSFLDRELLRELKTVEGSLLRRSTLNETKLDEDVGTILEYYRDRGYLDARVDRSVQLSPDNREAIVTFEIDEGPVFTLRGVKIETGSDAPPVISDAQAMGLMSVKPGDVYGQRAVRESAQRVAEAYGKMGWVDAQINVREIRDSDRPVVDLLLLVREGGRFRAGVVTIQGNDITQDSVIRKDVTIQPDRPLDMSAVEESRRRLERSRLFATDNPKDRPRLTIQPETADEPWYRDVLVEIKETNTGSIAFGGTVGSDGGLAARFSIQQRNFDILDWPSSFSEYFGGRGFRGGGQTFSVEVSPGDRVQSFSISLGEPSLFDSDYSGGISLYARRRVYREYDDIRYGTELSVGRRFGSRWNGSATLGLQSVALDQIEASAPTDYFAVGDETFQTSLGASITRTTTDRPILPTQGTKITLGVEQIGALGGDFTYSAFNASYGLIVPVNEDILGNRSTLAFNIGSRYIPQSPDEVPFYSRYYLGGESFRGFGVRGISPRGVRNDNGLPSSDPIGGTFQFSAGVEFQQPIIADQFLVVLFADTGTVNNDVTFDNYRASVGFGIRLITPLSPVPLAFDFGFPILKEEGDRERLLTFTVDVPFR